MAKPNTGTLNFTRMMQAAKAGHSAFFKSEKTGDIFCAFKQWTNNEPDQFKNDGSIQLNSTKEKAESEKDLFHKGYIGNFRMPKGEQSNSNESNPFDIPEPEDLPF